jgi:sigma-E factor negative regulatory protein RseA
MRNSVIPDSGDNGAPRKTVASGRNAVGEAQLYESTASIAPRQCNAQQVFRAAQWITHRRDGTTMDTNKKNRELISALSDGEIPDTDQELALAALDSPAGQQAWELFHHIGGVLRAAPTPDLSPGFAERLAARLADEPLPGKRTAVAGEETSGPAPAVVAGPG